MSAGVQVFQSENTDVSLGEFVCALFDHLLRHVRCPHEEAHTRPLLLEFNYAGLKNALKEEVRM